MITKTCAHCGEPLTLFWLMFDNPNWLRESDVQPASARKEYHRSKGLMLWARSADDVTAFQLDLPAAERAHAVTLASGQEFRAALEAHEATLDGPPAFLSPPAAAPTTPVR